MFIIFEHKVMAAIINIPEKIIAYRPCEGGESEYLVKYVGMGFASAKWLIRDTIQNNLMVDLYRSSAKIEEKKTDIAKLEVSIMLYILFNVNHCYLYVRRNMILLNQSMMMNQMMIKIGWSQLQ